MNAQLCVSPYCGLPRQHLEGCDGHREECESDRCEGCCRGCLPARAADGVYLCPRCRRFIVEDAWRAVELYNALEDSLTGSGKGGEKTSGTSGAGTELNTAAVEARSAVRSTLITLVRLISEERGVSLPWGWVSWVERLPYGFIGPPNRIRHRFYDSSLPAMARMIQRHADWLAAHSAADEHARDLRDLATDSRTWRLAYPSASDRLYIGECPLPRPTEDGSRQVCGSRLYQLPDEVLVTCKGCGRSETVEWWQRTITGEAGGQVDAYAAAAHLSVRWRRTVEPVLIRQWASRGKVMPVLDVEAVAGRHVDACARTDCAGCYRRPTRDARNRVLYPLPTLVDHARKLWGDPADDPTRRAV